LLFGMANNLLGPAVMMVVAISLGMAVAMSGIGVLAILGRKFVDRKLEGDVARHQRFAGRARIVGAAAVLLVGLSLFGLTLTLDSLPQPAASKPETG
jgi:nickel/cobalt exporter